MRDLPFINELWTSDDPGRFIGLNRPHAFVTIEKDWFLFKESRPGRIATNRTPVRWWQAAANDQEETELPNVQTITITRDIGTDAAEATITLLNVLPRANGETPPKDIGQWGYQGGMWPSYGQSKSVTARWGHQINEWHRALLPGTLVRTYQGYGGHGKTREQAIADGNVSLTGVWKVDSVTAPSDGVMTLQCRDMASLLIDQPLYPPLVPRGCYPTRFWKYTYHTRKVANPPTPARTAARRLRYADSSSDRWYGCVDTETEALTRRGWATLDEIKPDDEMLGINPETGQTEWQKLKALLRYEVEDETMLHIKAKGFDALTTMNHRWLVQKLDASGQRRWAWTMSQNLSGGDHIPRIAPYGAAPENAVHSDEFVELVGWFWTEGTASASGDVSIYQSMDVNEANCASIERCLESELGPAGPMCKAGDHCTKDGHDHPGWSHGDYGKGVHYRVTRRYARKLMEAAPSRVLAPEFLDALTAPQLELLFQVSMLADAKAPSVMAQRSEDRIRAFEILCAMTGRKFSTHLTGEDMFSTSIVEPGHHGGSTFYYHRASHRELVSYTGTVWCPTVKHGNWLARRNGKPFITGNSNASIHGHRPSHALDGRSDTFWLSVGNSHPDRPFCADFIEFTSGEQLNAISMQPWAGNYEMYVSVMENGRWLGDKSVPYDHSPLIGNQPHVVNTGASIPYVARFSVPWEQMKRYQLPRVYKAERVRLTFRRHHRSQWGPQWFYRCGVREVRAEMHEGTPAPRWTAFAAHPDGYGYWAVSEEGRLQWFGDAKNLGNPTAAQVAATRSKIVDIVATPSGNGYYILAGSGKVWAFGDAVHHGEPSLPGDAVALALCSTGGYWIARSNGSISSRGGAPSYSSAPAGIVDASAHTNGVGLYLLHRHGGVYVRGDAIHRGHGPSGTYVAIAAQHHGDGYWLQKTGPWDGLVRVGDMPTVGSPYEPKPEGLRAFDEAVDIAISPTIGGNPTGVGVLTLHGKIYSRKEFKNVGEPAGGEATIRKPGNYKDLSEIVKLILLWSGFWLKGGNPPGKEPAVFGNIEAAGFAPDEEIKEDFFDKKSGMDVITAIKEIIGYHFFVDAEGAVRFASPNFWQAGNFLNTGKHVKHIPEVDERHNLIGYNPTLTGASERDRIIVSDGEPLSGIPGVRAVTWHQPKRYLENRSDYLRGQLVPAMIQVPFALSRADMLSMAALLGIQIRFKRLSATWTAIANPALELDDQVRLLERTSSSNYIHVIRAITTTQDLKSGSYTMECQSTWVGTGSDNWAIVTNRQGHTRFDNSGATDADDRGVTVLSEDLSNRLGHRFLSTDVDRATVPLHDMDAPIPPDGGGGNPA